MKEQPPQLNKKNLSMDYSNELCKIYGTLSIMIVNEELCRRINKIPANEYILSGHEIKTYTRRYPTQNYEYDITPEIEKINDLATQVNKLINKKSENYENIFNLMNDIYLTLTNEPLKKIKFKK